ncbi:hypothetical protein H0H93_014157 [Arthromyces matolae]|nr:hypothetical protein H0H93_014157 [Arthromyces matolae]
MPLPPFLRPESPGQVGGHYFNAVFPRKQPFHSSHALWWPSKAILPTTVILFIPGKSNAQPRGLLAQVEGSVEALDAIRSTYGVETNIIVVGHSVGGWLALQLLKVRSTAITRVFLLFPTLCHIADTTNGQQLSVRQIFNSLILECLDANSGFSLSP